MKSKTLILMVVAVVCGLGASYMTSRLLAERNNEKSHEEEKVPILVAKKNIPQGTFIKVPEEWFVEKEFTKGEEPKKAVRTFEEVKDRVLNKPLSAEQWVVSDDLLRKDQSGLAYALPKGMRAVTIRVNVDTVVAGFVQPNSRVDILNTVRSTDKDSYSQTILQNMLVLASDQIDQKDQDKKAIISSTVTLAVTPEEAQELSLAQTFGELRLVLRPQDDGEQVKIKAVKMDDIRNSKTKGVKGVGAEEGSEGSDKNLTLKVPDVNPMNPTTPEAPVAEPIKRKKPHVLLVLNGDTTTKAVFLDDGDEYETQIQKSDPEPKPEKAPGSPDKAAPTPKAPAPPAPTQDQPKPPTRQRGK